MTKKLCVYFQVAVMLLCFLFLSFGLAFAQDAAGAITSARQQLVICYELAAGAERAGGNMTGLATALNEAGALLSEAELAYSAGDFGGASSLAIRCLDSLKGFVAEASDLKTSGELALNTDFLATIVISSVGTSVVICASVGIWFYLKRSNGQ